MSTPTYMYFSTRLYFYLHLPKKIYIFLDLQTPRKPFQKKAAAHRGAQMFKQVLWHGVQMCSMDQQRAAAVPEPRLLLNRF